VRAIWAAQRGDGGEYQGLRVVQAFRRQGTVLADFDGANTAVRDTTIRAQLMMTLLRDDDGVEQPGHRGHRRVGWLAALRDMVRVGVIATFVLYARRFFEPLLTWPTCTPRFSGAGRRRARVRAAGPDAGGAGSARHRRAGDVPGPGGFRRVTFGYTPGVPVLREVSLTAEPGQWWRWWAPPAPAKPPSSTAVALL
jgi:ATP-binding cassette subfamily B protein